jgi:hypothetical protein
MKCRIYRITLNNGDWYEVGSSQRSWAVGSLANMHYGGMSLAEFKRTYKPSAKDTGERTYLMGPITSNTYYEAD